MMGWGRDKEMGNNNIEKRQIKMEGERERKGTQNKEKVGGQLRKVCARKNRNTKRKPNIWADTFRKRTDSSSWISPLLTSFVVIDFKLMCIPLDACWIPVKSSYTYTLYQHNPVKRILIGVHHSL